MTKLTPVLTDDGSITYRNEDINETYHTTSGALDEALKKHVESSQILQEARLNNQVTILDICFGLGYNTIVAISEILHLNPACHITVFAFENDQAILDEIKLISFPHVYKDAANLILQLVLEGEVRTDNLHLKLFKGDFQTTLSFIPDAIANTVFFDPFSPKKQPELWTEEVFNLVIKKMKKNATLTTYSCAKSVRSAMHSAGFKTYDGPRVGRKSPSTVALKE